ncbi:MAG TPA: SRPBCC domain-containing protein [Sphingobacteriaceae bacterium]
MTSDFTATILVDQTPKEVFDAVTNVRGWWSEEIEGNTASLNDEFTYHYEDVHYSKMKLIEVIPNQKVVWLVKYNYFKFTEDKSEWTGTKISFEIEQKGDKTQLIFTHHGLTPENECFNVCSNAWGQYIQQSLFNLITTGKGQPNRIGRPQTADEEKLGSAKNQNYTATLVVNTTLAGAFKKINSVTLWWTQNLEGRSENLNDEFTVRFGDVHESTQRIVELVPEKKVVWLVTNSKLNFLENKQEWTDTRISFELSAQGNKTQVDFTHFGLVPQVECYNDCVKGWDYFIKGSLFKLLTEGKGTPES